MSKKHKHYNGKVASVKVVEPPCHVGFKEVHEGVFVGKAMEILDVIDKVDVLIPLDSVNGSIWNSGWNGEIYYVPVKDYSTLPVNIEREKVQYVLDRIAEGKKVAIFCLGGHGRTGYFASLVLGKLGIEDPIKVLRETYCKNAVESNEQVEAIADFLGNYELISKYPCWTKYSGYDAWFDYDDVTGTTINYDNLFDGLCGGCEEFKDIYGALNWGYCNKCFRTVNKYDQAWCKND